MSSNFCSQYVNNLIYVNHCLQRAYVGHKSIHILHNTDIISHTTACVDTSNVDQREDAIIVFINYVN